MHTIDQSRPLHSKPCGRVPQPQIDCAGRDVAGLPSFLPPPSRLTLRREVLTLECSLPILRNHPAGGFPESFLACGGTRFVIGGSVGAAGVFLRGGRRVSYFPGYE